MAVTKPIVVVGEACVHGTEETGAGSRARSAAILDAKINACGSGENVDSFKIVSGPILFTPRDERKSLCARLTAEVTCITSPGKKPPAGNSGRSEKL